MNAVEINNLNKRYKNGRGIWDINLAIKKGQIFGFLGPNGSGKTTTLKIIVGLLKKDSGTIRILGHDIENQFEQVMRQVGCMFESIAHYDTLTAYENIKQIARFYPEINQKRIDEVLELVHLNQYKKDKVGTFSLGMRQRLALAEAMYNSPRLMILDEPLNGLDIEGMVEVRNMIINFAEQEGTTFLISSHLSTEIEKTCTHVAVIRDGILLNTSDVSSILNFYPTIEDYFLAQVNLYKQEKKS